VKKNMKTLTLTYEINQDLAKALFVAGKDDEIRRTVTFNAEKLTEATRAEWAKRFGLKSERNVGFYSVSNGEVYSDGSVDSEAPVVEYMRFSTDFLQLDRVLRQDSDEDLAYVLAAMARDEAETHEQREQQLVKWHAAKEMRERQKVIEAEEKARREEVEKPIRREYNEKIEKLEARINKLAGYLEKLIIVSGEKELEVAGLIAGRVGEDQEEVTAEQQEALETAGLDC
jgi:hypothetical protein